jgi:5-methylcytosine-specific restriction enzyme subunit McrC
MLNLSEQKENSTFKNDRNGGLASFLKGCEDSIFSRSLIRHGEVSDCLKIRYDSEEDLFYYDTSYFVGIDWIKESDIAVQILPKENFCEQEYKVDYYKMLMDSLTTPENFNHLDDFLYIFFDKPYICIDSKDDILSPFLVAEYIQILKRIVRRGLKKNYYFHEQNLNSKIKGKILVGENIKKNLLNGRYTMNICKFQEFGYDNIENRILKKALVFSQRVLSKMSKYTDTTSLQEIITYIYPAFESISDQVDVSEIKNFRNTSFYRDYKLAIKYALLILKRYSYNQANADKVTVMIPPFWIDMSKLFELYVYHQLSDIFGSNNVIYHMKTNYQELDFLIKKPNENYQFVVDTKYKPIYNEHKIKKEDIRQVCGYARMESVYKELGMTDYSKIVKCLIIYSNKDCSEQLTLSSFDFNPLNGIDKIRKESGYVDFYKLGICLPKTLG